MHPPPSLPLLIRSFPSDYPFILHFLSLISPIRFLFSRPYSSPLPSSSPYISSSYPVFPLILFPFLHLLLFPPQTPVIPLSLPFPSSLLFNPLLCFLLSSSLLSFSLSLFSLRCTTRQFFVNFPSMSINFSAVYLPGRRRIMMIKETRKIITVKNITTMAMVRV